VQTFIVEAQPSILKTAAAQAAAAVLEMLPIAPAWPAGTRTRTQLLWVTNTAGHIRDLTSWKHYPLPCNRA